MELFSESLELQGVPNSLLVKMTKYKLYAWMVWCTHRFYEYYRRRQKVLSIKRCPHVTNIKLLKILNISRFSALCQLQNDANSLHEIFKWILLKRLLKIIHTHKYITISLFSVLLNPISSFKDRHERSGNTPDTVSRFVITEYTVSCKMSDCS